MMFDIILVVILMPVRLGILAADREVVQYSDHIEYPLLAQIIQMVRRFSLCRIVSLNGFFHELLR